jgi:DNA-directed RNA polymerase specialized sigma24 family protein
MRVLEWEEIYGVLRASPNDAIAWHSLRWRVQGMAAAIRDLGRHAVEDVVEDTCSRVVLDIDSAYGPDTFAGFVFGHFRTAKRSALAAPVTVTLEDGGVAGVEAGGPDPDDVLLLRDCLERLGSHAPRQRDAVALRHLWGVPYGEIAAHLDVTENNARQLVHLGLVGMRPCVGEGAHGA